MTNSFGRGLAVDVASALAVLALAHASSSNWLSTTWADAIRGSAALFLAVMVARGLVHVCLADPDDKQQAHNLLTVISVYVLVIIAACTGWLTWPIIGYILAAIIVLWGTIGIAMLVIKIRDLYRPIGSRRHNHN